LCPILHVCNWDTFFISEASVQCQTVSVGTVLKKWYWSRFRSKDINLPVITIFPAMHGPTTTGPWCVCFLLTYHVARFRVMKFNILVYLLKKYSWCRLSYFKKQLYMHQNVYMSDISPLHISERHWCRNM
jgi:hypothetical protein